MISLSFRNPPSAEPPFDIAKTVRDLLVRMPAALHRKVWHWYPGQPNVAGMGAEVVLRPQGMSLEQLNAVAQLQAS